jgi:hypothetical protein
MSNKMNWDRVRWEDRAARQGSEWAISGGVAPHLSGLDPSAPIGMRSSIPTAGGSKKKKKKKKHKVARPNMQVQTRGSAAGNSKPSAPAGTIIRVPPKAAGSLKSPSAGGAYQASRDEKAPVFRPKVNSGRIHHAGDPLSLPEIQTLTIRLYKALSEHRMMKAASLALEIRRESLRHIENATSERTSN